jgi:MFS superfamily sulfate permease-like transporter
VGGALLGTMPAGGGTSQTALNRRAGARTQLAELVTAGGTLLTMLFLAGPMGLMPQATLAGVVIVYSIGLIDPAGFRAILRIRRMEFVWGIVALAGVVLLGTLKGILVAIVLSLLALAQQVANPPLYVLGRKRGTNVFRPLTPDNPDGDPPGLLLREGRIFFANAARLWERVRVLVEPLNPKVLVLDMSGVFDLEYSALKSLVEGEERLRGRGIELWLVAITPGVLEVVQRSGLGATLGPERMHFNLEAAVRQYQTKVSSAP